MSQISLPVRILLIGAVVFLAAWLTVLRPKPVEIEPATTPTTTTTTTATPASGPGKIVDAAKKAAADASAAASARAGEAPATTTDPATGAATTSKPDAKAPETPAALAIPAEALAKLPKDVAGALEERKVLVLAVFGDEAKPWSPTSDDDRYVNNALRDVNRYDGEVHIKRIAAGKLSTYGPLVNALEVDQTPSIVVIDRDLKGRVLTGYVDRIAINQAIADARRDSINPDISDDYLRQANALCGHYETRVTRWSQPTIPGRKAVTASLKRRLAITQSYRRQLARIDAPAKWRGLKAAWLKGMKSDEAVLTAYVTASKSGKKADVAAAKRLYDKNDWASLDRRFNEAGLTDCAENRRS